MDRIYVVEKSSEDNEENSTLVHLHLLFLSTFIGGKRSLGEELSFPMIYSSVIQYLHRILDFLQ